MKTKKSAAQKHDQNMQVRPAGEGLRWHDPRQTPFRICGLAWFKKDRLYRRMPMSLSTPLPPAVEALSWNLAGGQVRFRTDSTDLSVRVTLRGLHSMDHITATGQCGLDCYIGEPGKTLYCSTTRFDRSCISYSAALFKNFSREWRTVTLNLPLYQGMEELEIGLDPAAKIKSPPAFDRPGRVIFYGTSVTQGGCANRPGMAATNILSRQFNVEFINLGFSGSGRGEPDVARIVASIPDPLVIVLDYEANAGLAGIRQTLNPFIDILRAAHPRVPIVVMSRTNAAISSYHQGSRKADAQARAFQRRTVTLRQRQGDRRIEFIDGSRLMGKDPLECMVDGSHPTDLGFYRIAENLKPVLARALRRT